MIKFHWAMPTDSGQRTATENYNSDSFDIEGLVGFAKAAEVSGIESLLMGISYHMPDPIPLIAALSRETKKIKFILAYRPGLLSPTLFSQVVNTISWLNDGRIDLNIVAGISPAEQAYYGDYCNHQERYARAEEFLDISTQLWNADKPLSYNGEFYNIKEAELGLNFKDGNSPDIYLSGGSETAQGVAEKYADALLRYGDTPEKLVEQAAMLHSKNLKLGIRMHVIARPTREEALALVDEMVSNSDEVHKAEIAEFVEKCDSSAVKKSFELAEGAKDDWLSPMVWSGAVAYRGGPALTIVGSYDEVADYLNEYNKAGVDEFILSGWPTRDEMERFCSEVLPRYRAIEATEVAA